MSAESTEKISHGLTGKRRGEDRLFRFTYFKLCGKPGLYGFVNWNIFFSVVCKHCRGTCLQATETLKHLQKIPRTNYLSLKINHK